LLIDEPTTGLHMQDVNNLINTLRSIVDSGHSVILVEHNPQVLRSADWILEMGPGAGIDGGKIVATGNPLSLREKATLTSKFIFPTLVHLQILKNSTVKKLPQIVSEIFPLSVQGKTTCKT
jgi:excinuclease ABC subunit A